MSDPNSLNPVFSCILPPLSNRDSWGATGLGAVSQGAKAIKAVRGAKQVSKNLKKAQRHAQSRSRRGKDSFNADKKVNSLQNEIRGDIKDAGEAVNSGVTPTVSNSVNAQAGIVESAVGLFGAAAEGARREDE